MPEARVTVGSPASNTAGRAVICSRDNPIGIKKNLFVSDLAKYLVTYVIEIKMPACDTDCDNPVIMDTTVEFV
jgi:hypothetical protein